MKNVQMEIKRGDILYANLSGVYGSEQGGERPVVVIQNNMGNKFSPCIIVAMITSKLGKKMLPTHVALHKEESGLTKDSLVLAEQLRTIDKGRIIGDVVKSLDESTMIKIDKALAISIGLPVQQLQVA